METLSFSSLLPVIVALAHSISLCSSIFNSPSSQFSHNRPSFFFFFLSPPSKWPIPSSLPIFFFFFSSLLQLHFLPSCLLLLLSFISLTQDPEDPFLNLDPL
ncbi:hypothetical protein NE237_029299 [Protea cynaroides]|uniref:Uncharacterized protein n=1 Tax=Protea cynaroides TaxID=273540 RepID=A0A9Q0GV03_9MAGN|nr:hypothetical protein NE237_029299 [Protea cynaroides]